MSPNEMNHYREEFNEACKTLGWSVKTVEYPHERDERYGNRTAQVWFNCLGERLFDEDSVEEGLIKQIIYIAAMVSDTRERLKYVEDRDETLDYLARLYEVSLNSENEP